MSPLHPPPPAHTWQKNLKSRTLHLEFNLLCNVSRFYKFQECRSFREYKLQKCTKFKLFKAHMENMEKSTKCVLISMVKNFLEDHIGNEEESLKEKIDEFIKSFQGPVL